MQSDRKLSADGDESQAPLILLVDDDPGVLRVVHRLLERAGFEVLAASNASDALDILRRSVRRVNLIVSDVEMPRMSGVELVETVSQEFPEIPTVLMSGRPVPVKCDGTVWEFVSKPFSPHVFIRLISRVVRDHHTTLSPPMRTV